MKSLQLFVLAVFLAGTVVYSRGDVTPIGSSIRVSADANAGASPAQDTITASQTTTLNSFSNSITEEAVNGDLQATVVSGVTANWASASAGVFTINDSFATSDLSQYASSRVGVDSSSWTYSIVSDVPATLTLNYSVAYTGPYPYSSVVYFQAFQGPTANLFDWPLVTQASLSGVGMVQVSLDASTDYSFLVFDGSNLNQDLPAFTSNMNGNFSFQIAPVPEPPALALAGVGALMAVVFAPNWRKRTRS